MLTRYSTTHAISEATGDFHVDTTFDEESILQLLMTELLTLSPTDTRSNDALQPDTQMLEIGLDSIAVGALSGVVRNATGITFKMADALQGEITVRQLAQSLVGRVEKARSHLDRQSGQTMETSVETNGPLFGKCEILPLLFPSHPLLHTHSPRAIQCAFGLSTACSVLSYAMCLGWPMWCVLPVCRVPLAHTSVGSGEAEAWLKITEHPVCFVFNTPSTL